MHKRPDFASELVTLQSEVAADIGTVLEAVKATKTTHSTLRDQPVTPTAETTHDVKRQPASAHAARRRRQIAQQSDVERAAHLENVTTRLTRETNELLTAASLRQRLRKRTPATRQDIIEEAVQHWLAAHGYLGAGDS